MDVIIWAIILGAVFYINKKSKSAGSKNTQPNKPRPQQKQIQQIWNSMQNTVQSGMNALNQTYQQKQQPQMQQRAHQPQRPQMQQRVQPQQRPQQSNPDIVQRAVKNNARFADDTTQKELIHRRVLELQKKKKLTNYRLYTDLKLNPGNVNAWLKHNDSSKMSLDCARQIYKYAKSYPSVR